MKRISSLKWIPFFVGLLLSFLISGIDGRLSITTARAVEPLRVQFPVEKFTLKNGLTVLLHQDRTVPMVSYHTWYRVGSRNETPGVTGAAHMLAHMMCKGAKKYSGSDFDRILHENGITNNAFTSWDYTGFYENLPSSKLELIMDLEVDRMRFLALRAEDLKSELEVVKEERRWRIDNNPASLVQEALLETLFRGHPYGWPVIGTMEDITAYTPEKLKHFYDTFYVPNNAVLVIAGDIDIGQTRKWVEKYYGVLEFHALPQAQYPPEPEPKKSQKFVKEAEVQGSTVMLAYKGVENGHPDSFALDLASVALGEGSSSRLYKRLVYEKQLAIQAGGQNFTMGDPGFFAVSAILRPGRKADEAEVLMRQEVQRLKTSQLQNKELQKTKNQLMKGYIDELTTIDGKARALAVNEITRGSYEKLFSDLELYQKVTASDIQRVAKKYLTSDREVVGILNRKSVADSSEPKDKTHKNGGAQ